MNEVLRPLTAQEELYWRLTYNDQIHPVIAAEIEGRLPLQDWQRALEAVRRRHPLLSVAIEMPSEDKPWTQPMFRMNHEPLLIREVYSQGSIAIAREIEAELAKPFLAGKGPLIRVVLLQSESTSVLILSVSHSVADGMSMLYVLHDLLATATGDALEELPVAATAESLLHLMPEGPTKGVLERITESSKAGLSPAVELVALSEGDADSVVAIARAHETTLHSVLVAALVSAMRQANPSFEKSRFALSLLSTHVRCLGQEPKWASISLHRCRSSNQ